MKVNLKIRKIQKEEYKKALRILENGLGKKRVKSNKILPKKFERFSKFFIGAFLNKKIVGFICGYPRKDYLQISMLAIDSKFRGKGLGKKLVKEFEKTAKDKYKKINVGAEDKVLGFYSALGYKPFLLIQFKPKDNFSRDFSQFKIIKKYNFNGYLTIEAKIIRYDLKGLDKLRKKYPKAYFQYIFTKELK